jgi:hypothetical protein
MGEYAEMMLDGTCCAGCGEYMGGGSPGHPGYCSAACGRDAGLADEVVAARKLHTSFCQVCGKGFKVAASRDQHSLAKHGK